MPATCTSVKVFRQAKGLRPESEVIREKRSRSFASSHKKASATNYRRFHGIQKRDDAKPLNHRDFSKDLVKGLEMNRLVKKIMHEEFAFIFKRCSKDLVTDLGNENISEKIEASGKRLALGCTLQWNTKCRASV